MVNNSQPYPMQAIAGHLMVLEDGYQLPRWRVTAFPDAVAMKALEARSVADNAADNAAGNAVGTAG